MTPIPRVNTSVLPSLPALGDISSAGSGAWDWVTGWFEGDDVPAANDPPSPPALPVDGIWDAIADPAKALGVPEYLGTIPTKYIIWGVGFLVLRKVL